jgi:pimeloyl-ACP methyl ester carboxylesterase
MKHLLLLTLGGMLAAINTRSSSATDETDGHTGTASAADGLRIRYDLHGQGATTLVFIHGWAVDHTIWQESIKFFAPEYQILTMDLAGHGDSGIDRANWSIAGLAEDLETIVRGLGLKQVVLIGHSMGGPTALLAAQRMPELVLGVVGADTFHDAEYKLPDDQISMLMSKLEADFPGTVRELMPIMFSERTDPALVTRIVEKAVLTDKKGAIPLLRDLYGLDLKTVFAETRKPIRSVNAAPWSPWGLPTAVETNRKYSDYQVAMLEGVRHYPMVEQPAEFNRLLEELLKGLAADR